MRALFLSSILLASCASAALGKDVDIAVQQSVALAPGITAKLESVSDSRCPIKLHCVRAGELIYHLSLHAPDGDETFDLSLATPSHITHQLTLRLHPDRAPAVPVAREALPAYFIALRIEPTHP